MNTGTHVSHKPHVNFIECSQHCTRILCIFQSLCYALPHSVHLYLHRFFTASTLSIKKALLQLYNRMEYIDSDANSETCRLSFY